ncbi:MAG: siderophore-interacting protein [Actinomycetota bacterium]
MVNLLLTGVDVPSVLGLRDSCRVTSDDAASTIRRVRREPPSFRRVAVRSTEPLSQHMLRVVLGGVELAGFALESPASSVRLLLPPAGADEIEMPTWTGNQFELANGDRAPIRTFTPRAFDADRSELTLDVVLHESGAANDWARRASVGDVVAISGPGRSEPLDDDARTFLLAGDETAMPAIGQLLEWIEPDRAIDVHIEVRSAAARIELPGHPGATVTWYEAGADAAPGDSVVAAVQSIDRLPDAIWVAGEAAAVQRLRKHLFDDRGLPRRRVTARGYWKLGRSAT